MSNNYNLKKISFSKSDEYYLTIKRGYFKTIFFEKLVDYFNRQNTKIVKVVLFGASSKLKEYEYFSSRFPLLIICDSVTNDTSDSGSEMNQDVGACIYFVGLKKKSDFIYIKDSKDNVLGAYYKVGNFEFLSKTFSDDVVTQEVLFKDEVTKEYVAGGSLLNERKFNFKNVYRFWNYMSDIYSNYKDFNDARDVVFERDEIIKYPAATGIETSFLDSKSISISFEAVKGGGVIFDIISSDLQCDPYLYGPKFSRAMCLSFKENNTKKIYISGISSIDVNGKSILKDSRKENVEYVMKSTENLLEKVGMSYGDIIYSYVYAIDKDILTIFQNLYESKGWDFPYIWIETPICRNDLFFEVECMASNGIESLDIDSNM